MTLRSWYCWGMTPLLPTDVPDPMGGALYCRAKIRPWWYWTARRISLFTRIVWRRWDAQSSRMDVATAWEVSSVAVGFTCDSAKKGE